MKRRTFLALPFVGLVSVHKQKPDQVVQVVNEPPQSKPEIDWKALLDGPGGRLSRWYMSRI